MSLSAKIGFGGKARGKAVVLAAGEGYRANLDLSGKIVVLLDLPSRELLEKLSLVGIGGLVAPTIHYRDYLQLISEGEFPLLILKQFGKLDVKEDLVSKLGKLEGVEVTIDGEGKELST